MKFLPYLIILLFCSFTYDASSQSESRLDEATFTKVDQMPEYPGCEHMSEPSARKSCAFETMIQYLSEHIVYPIEAKAAKLEGTVVVRFVVNKEGKVTKAIIAKGFDKACDTEALRVVNEMPLWTPGKQNGKKVATELSLPIRFSL